MIGREMPRLRRKDTKKPILYSVGKLHIKAFKGKEYLELDKQAIQQKEFININQPDSLFLEQLRKVTGKGISDTNLDEIILLVAPKPSKGKSSQNDGEMLLRKVLSDGFYIDNTHYVRYGKSASQGKAGVTVFVDEKYYPYLFESSQLGVSIEDCVISKYESQRNLTLSSCTIVNDELPYIVIVDEYTKTLENQYIRYVVESKKNIIDKETSQEKTITVREIKEGYHDIKLSPFDGCGCHSYEMSKKWSEAIGLDYIAIGAQVRLPFMKGYSIEVPFKEYYKERGITAITDVFGQVHNVEDIDCIWNISMWKGYGIFKDKFGNQGFVEYIRKLKHYGYHLGISKYSHHTSHINIKTRMNFQYLQCLNLWNPKYVQWFLDHKTDGQRYNTFEEDDRGPIINLARYTTDMYEKIIKGDKFYTYKYLGLDDTDDSHPNSKYMEAVLINDVMLKDPAIKGFIYRKLQKAIEQAKFGKIYSDGFYHTCVGDMIGYLEYCAGDNPVGCLKAGEFFCDTIPKGDVLSFRSPLVCPSEVNKVTIVTNPVLKKWFSRFKDQDVVMINMYDISLPQQGGADMDGDSLLLCHDPLLINTKIDKPIIIDVEDKISALKKPYTKENIVEYELNSRDNRIGEITNVATAILNQYVEKDKWKKVNYDNVSLLRIFQGKEIDSIKTGVRWQLTSYLRKAGKRLPYFMLYRYPKKLNRYFAISKKNKGLPQEERIPNNAYHSPSPMNELCDYILTWEKRKVKWDNSCVNTSYLLLDNSIETSDRNAYKKIRKVLNAFSSEWMQAIADKEEYGDIDISKIVQKCSDELFKIVPDRKVLSNYCIRAAYANMSCNKSLVWQMFGDEMLQNLKKNSPQAKRTKIIETTPYNPDAYEFLGKYYQMIEGVMDISN